jgi:hypothetical protein
MTKKEMINEMIVTFEKQLIAFTGRKIRLLVVDYDKANESTLSRPEIEDMMKRNFELAFGIHSFSIDRKTRRQPYPETRFGYFYLHRQYFPKYPLKELGKQLGFDGKDGTGDHTAPIFGIAKHKEFYNTDDNYTTCFNRAVYRIEKALTEKVETI